MTMAPESPCGGVLDAAEIRRLLEGERPLVRDVRDRDRQLQPNGIDLTLESVWAFDGAGQLGVDDAARVLAARREVTPTSDS